MSELERKMHIAMQESRWWEVGSEHIEDMANLAMGVVREYTDSIDEILLSGYDAEVKIQSIIFEHERLIRKQSALAGKPGSVVDC